MIIKELWAPEDQSALDALVAALGHNDLVGALLAISRADARSAARCRGLLAAWSARLRVGRDSPLHIQAAELRRLLVDDLGFAGDTEDYYHPHNSQLDQVLERRRGLPILVSCVWILVGRGAGLTIDGVGMPGHFIVRLGGDDGLLIDPFARGAGLTAEDCRRIVTRMATGVPPWQESFLDPTPVDQIVERVLNNLVGAHARLGQLEPVYGALRCLVALRPERPSPLLQQALVSERLGARGHAAELYGRVRARFPESDEAGTAGRRLDELGDVKQWVN